MIAFADAIDKGLDLKGEIGNYNNFRDIPLFKQTLHILRGRKLFYKTCNYLSEGKGDLFSKYVGESYAEIAMEWDLIWRMMAKLFFF